MTIRLSRLNLRAILILVVSASKGITLVFKNDPLQNVDVSSTFDSVEVIRGYLQQEIEGQLREMFREDLPGIIHRLSQRWLGGSGTQGKVEMPYRDGIDGASAGLGTPSAMGDTEEEVDPNDPYAEKEIFPPHVPSTSPPNAHGLTPRRRAMQQAQAARNRRPSNAAVSESPTSYTHFPDIEDYDPTYGLRPEGVPTHSGYEAFGRLWEKARQGEGRGLGSLMQTRVEEERTGDVSDEDWNEPQQTENGDLDIDIDIDQVEHDDALRPVRRHMRADSHYTNATIDEEAVEWETFPAVGGGVISRPRVYHSQSQIRAPSESGAMPSPGTGSVTARASSIGGASSTIGSLKRFPYTQPMTPLATPRHQAQAGPGPSSLRRMATSRSDVFVSHQHHRATRSEVPQPFPTSRSQRNMAQTPSAPRTGTASGNSWSTGQPSRSNTMSTLASSQLPSSKSMSIESRPSHLQQNQLRHQRSTSLTGTSPGRSFPPRNVGLGGITLPLNNSVSQLATLSHSNHTLSPYARGHEHIAVRSFPHLGKATPSVGAQSRSSSGDGASSKNIMGNVKARRKRMYRLNVNKESGSSTPLSPDLDDTPPNYEQTIHQNQDSYHQQNRHPHQQPSYSPEEDFRRLSFGSMDKNWDQPSLTGIAQRVMRPNVTRSPASRTSYGFPDTH